MAFFCNICRALPGAVPLLVLAMWGAACQTEPPRKDEKIAWLREHALPLRTVDPADTNYADLQFLKEELRGVEIIGLGEQSHGDGSTFEAKVRLIKFLREEMGFTVLAFESGILDGALALEALETGISADSAFRLGIFKIWSHSRELAPLRQYAVGQPAPFALPYVGFDCQFSGNLAPERRRDSLVHFIRRWEPAFDSAGAPAVWQALNMRKRKDYDRFRRDTALQRQFFSEMDTLVRHMSRIPFTTVTDRLKARGFAELKDYFNFTWNMNLYDPDNAVLNIRDSVMAENVVWLKEHLFPGQKIILWAANTHIGARRERLLYPDKMIPMGHYLKKRYDDRYYIMSFTSLDGRANSIQAGERSTPPSSNKTLEYVWRHTQAPYAYLRKQDLADWPFERPFQTRMFGFTNFYADWPAMTDGMFYIETMQPSHIDP